MNTKKIILCFTFAMYFCCVSGAAFADKTVDHRISVSDAMKKVEKYKEWMLGANSQGTIDAVLSPSIRDSSRYNLKNKAVRKFFQREKQRFGIDLGFSENASASNVLKKSRWMFVPQNSLKRPGERDFSPAIRTRPLLYGEKIAIAWQPLSRNPSVWSKTRLWDFIKYTKRRNGINLDWKSEPVYEWVVLGGQPGTPIQKGRDWVVIYNLKHKQPLIYFKYRNNAGHIGWPDSNPEGFGQPVLVRNEDQISAKVFEKLMMRDALRN